MESNKYFPKEALAFWDKLRCFNGMWEQIETGGYLPVVVINGENLGVDGDREEIELAEYGTGSYMISGCPSATYIGCKDMDHAVFLYWKDSEGKYYQDVLGVMEVERWFRETKKRAKK